MLYFALFWALFFSFWGSFNSAIFLEHLLPFSIIHFFWLIIFYIFGFYDLSLFKNNLAFYAQFLAGLGFCLIFGFVFFYLTPHQNWWGIAPKTNLLLNIVILGIFLFIWRKFFYFLFSSHFQNKVAIIGENPQAEELSLTIQNNPHLGYKLSAFFKSNEDVFQKIKEKKIDILILAENVLPDSLLAKNLYQCLPLKLNFMDLARTYEIICEKIPLSFVNQVWFLENLKEKEKGFYDKLKRIMDLVLACLLLLLTFPLWIFIAAAIKLEDRGPIFYSQKRIGRTGIPFLLIKFRSMRKEAEKETGPVWARKQDQRRTKVGKIIRELHLDELPQMINVLKGNISLVGPRPERPEFVSQLEKEIPHYPLRHLIRPGFTGWAQIKFRYGRSVMDSQEKFQYDLYYIKNRSLFLDLRILLKTCQLFFKKE